MQSVEYQSQPSFSHIEVPYDLELLGACAMSYHLISPGDQYDDVVNHIHHADWYIGPIQSWIEAALLGYRADLGFIPLTSHQQKTHNVGPFGNNL